MPISRSDFGRLRDMLMAVAAPVATAVLGLIVLPWFLGGDILIQPPEVKPEAIAGGEAGARLWVATTLVILIVATIAAVALSLWTMYERGCLGRGALWTVVVAGAMAWFAASRDFAIIDHLGNGVFDKTVGHYPAGGAVLAALKRSIDVANIAGIVVATAVAVAVACLAPMPLQPGAAADIDQAVRDIAGRARDLKYLLFAAAMVLFVAVVFMKAWRDWPLAYWDEAGRQAAGKAYEAVAAASVSYDACVFVLVLAAIFIPMALRLRAAGREVAARDPAVGSDPAARDRWLTAHGIVLSVSEQAQRVIAIVLPFLAAPAGDLVQAGLKHAATLLS